MPGGGLEESESFESAAARELYEETGCEFELGPYVWCRRHRLQWNGRSADQYERFFVAHTESLAIAAIDQDEYISGYEWWTIGEIQASQAVFAPREIGRILPDIINGIYPKIPFDCGV